MHLRTSIVCGVDGSAGSRAATRVAAEFAARVDARLVLVHAVADPPAFPYGDAWEQDLQRGRAVRAGQRLLDDAASDLDAVLRVTVGDPVAGLHTVGREEDAGFLVVGSRGRSGLGAELLGSVSAHVAHGAPCPVVIVPPDSARPFVARGGSLVRPYDESGRALAVAAELKEHLGLEPVVLNGDPLLELRVGSDDPRLMAVGSVGRGEPRPARRARSG